MGTLPGHARCAEVLPQEMFAHHVRVHALYGVFSAENGGPQASGRGNLAQHVSHKTRAHARHPMRAHARRQEKDFLGGSRSQNGGGARSAQDDLVMGADGQTQG